MILQRTLHDSALAELCKWECEIRKDDLFPFDMVKKCEVHKAKELGRPSVPTRHLLGGKLRANNHPVGPTNLTSNSQNQNTTLGLF